MDDRLGRVESKIDGLVQRIGEMAGTIEVLMDRNTQIAELRGRIVELEGFKLKLLGIFAGAGLLTGGAGNFIMDTIRRPVAAPVAVSAPSSQTEETHAR